MATHAKYSLAIVLASISAQAGWSTIDCFDPVDLDANFRSADVVVVARLSMVQLIDEGAAVSDFFFEGKEALKGDLFQELALRVHGGMGDSGLVGFDYLLFLKEGQTKVMECEPTVLRMQNPELTWYSALRESRNL